MVAVREQRDKVAEHMRGGWEPVQHQERRMLRIARLSIKDRRWPDLHVAIAYPGLGGIGEMGHCKSPRSEEHTSELQSLRHLVCRLLLEKKKKKEVKK